MYCWHVAKSMRFPSLSEQPSCLYLASSTLLVSLPARSDYPKTDCLCCKVAVGMSTQCLMLGSTIFTQKATSCNHVHRSHHECTTAREQPRVHTNCVFTEATCAWQPHKHDNHRRTTTTCAQPPCGHANRTSSTTISLLQVQAQSK